MRRSARRDAQARELDIDDLHELLLGERMEDDDLVDAVEELRAEVRPQLLEHRRAHDRLFGAADLPLVIEDAMAADVRGHDDDRVAEIDRVALTVGQTALVENLQEDVEDVGMRLLDLVEEHDASTDGVAPLR